MVTILFCDLSGSTALAEELDPEDWLEIVDGAFDVVAIITALEFLPDPERALAEAWRSVSTSTVDIRSPSHTSLRPSR